MRKTSALRKQWRTFKKRMRDLRRDPAPVALALGLCIILVIAFAQYRDAAARYAWQEWRAPRLALVLNAYDAGLAMDIGNYYYGGVILGRKKPVFDPKLAECAFREALEIAPTVSGARYGIARIAFANGDFENALEEIDAEFKMHPENFRTLYMRGLIYGYRGLPGDLSRAEQDFDQFTHWAPLEWAGYNDLMWILTKEGKYASAVEAAKTAFEKVPNGTENPWLWNGLGVALLNLGEMEDARTALQNALFYSEHLSEADWRRAYSGNDPRGAQQGLGAFRAGIRANLGVAEAAL